MATAYLAPGVYVEEVASGGRPIEAVGTSTAGFVGVAPDSTAHPNQVMAINNWSEFLRQFVKPDTTQYNALAQAVYGFFLNGGSRCYVVNVGSQGAIVGDARGRRGLDLLESVDDVAIVAIPGYTDPASHDAVLSHCEKLRDRFAVLDTPPLRDGNSVAQLTTVAQIAVGGGGGGGPTDDIGRARASNYGAQYCPHLLVRSALDATQTVETGPSGYVAGLYARTDALRGVFKAPANEQVRGAVGVTYRITHQEQEVLNPAGVNCIRFFHNEGIRVWGARTLAADAQWKYVPVRRLFNMIEESIALHTRWVVFEPNDQTLWNLIKRECTAFLTRLWRAGALTGRTPAEAFFVKCDAETNPPDEIDAGRVVILIGVAPVKPAEFVIFRIGQGVEGAQAQTEAKA